MEHFNTTIATSFIFFIIVEVILSSRQNLDNYDRKDSAINFCIGASNALLNLAFKGLALYFYCQIANYAPIHLNNQWWTWLLLFLLTDLFYYLFHVLGHKSMFFWASHVVHHSSAKFNLTTALRSGVTNTPFRFIFSTPLVFIGFEPEAIILMDSLILIYTFFIHTELIAKLGWIENILNTPSHHRVHHGSNPLYLDKNFGGVLIIWDKLFGTFQEEIQKPNYGLTKPIHTYNYFQILFHEWITLVKQLQNCTHWEERLNYIFNRPGWIPEKKKIFERNVFQILSRTVVIITIFLSIITPLEVKGQQSIPFIPNSFDGVKKQPGSSNLIRFKHNCKQKSLTIGVRGVFKIIREYSNPLNFKSSKIITVTIQISRNNLKQKSYENFCNRSHRLCWPKLSI